MSTGNSLNGVIQISSSYWELSSNGMIQIIQFPLEAVWCDRSRSASSHASSCYQTFYNVVGTISQCFRLNTNNLFPVLGRSHSVRCSDSYIQETYQKLTVTLTDCFTSICLSRHTCQGGQICIKILHFYTNKKSHVILGKNIFMQFVFKKSLEKTPKHQLSYLRCYLIIFVNLKKIIVSP